ncbi:MAG TPA: o-succinylbenzoate synthase [Nocardioidaceae bacterium]
MTDEASLRPLSGDARALERLLGRWLGDEAGSPLTVRTSGSAGEPKEVLLSASAVRASALATLTRIGGPGQWLLALPPQYVAGLQVLVRSLLAATSPVVLEEYPDVATATAAVTGERRYAALVPTQLHRLLVSDANSLAAYDVVLLGGAAAPDALLDRAREAGVNVVTTYGMSETCGGCVYDGVPLDGVAVALGSAGEIRLSGPVLFDGYAERPDLTETVLRDGWFHTSDIGGLDHDGRLVVLGRSDGVVITGGVNVPLSVVESRLQEMPGLTGVAITSRPDPEWGVEVVAVAARAPALPTLDAIRDFVAEVHPREWAPRSLVVVDELPMLSSGKVDTRRLPTLGSSDPLRSRPPVLRGTTREVAVFSLPMNVRFRGLRRREGMLIKGAAGVGEFSPFWDYDATESAAWLAAALEAADQPFPTPLRDLVPVNCTVPAVTPDEAKEIVARSHGCRTAKVKVAEPGQTLDDDVARVAAVREALGPGGRIRVDANGGWPVDNAVKAIAGLAEFDLEYVEQPVATVEDLALVRRRVDVAIAADESIRRASDPLRVKQLAAADIAVLKVQPLGGVRACLRLAEQISMPVVVSSALESSVGIAAGVALAAALPELPYACGLATTAMFTADVVDDPLTPVEGMLDVRRIAADPAALDAVRADDATAGRWHHRLAACAAVLEADRR